MRVLLPVARNDPAGTPLPLQWGEYHPGELVEARFGLREPADRCCPPTRSRPPRWSWSRRSRSTAAGVRLGRGAGFYDRSLPLAGPTARLVAVIRDDEFVDRLPAEPHDVRMTHALTPARGSCARG